MEFEELQKIWLADRQETVYAINEQAVSRLVQAKKNRARHIANWSEWVSILANLISGIIILRFALWKSSHPIIMYLLGGWMLLSSLYVLVSRIRRLRASQQYDRSILEELQHALQTARYQVRLSRIMRLNTIPIGTLCVLGIWNGRQLWWLSGLAALFFVVVYYMSGWEHNIYKRKKRELEQLQKKLN